MSNFIEPILELKGTILNLLTEFLKHIVLVSSAILGIIVTLASPPFHNTHLFYAVILLSLLSIVAGTIALYIAIIQHRRMSKDYLESVKQYVRDPDKTPRPSATSKYNALALAFEVICLISFLLSMVALAWYSLFINCS